MHVTERGEIELRPKLKYTGHPLLDVGVATICAFAEKMDPADLTYEDLDAIADYMEETYPEEPLKSALTVIFTSNSGFSQPSWKDQPEKRQEYARKVLRAYRPDISRLNERCVFTGEPAVAISFDLKDHLPPGRTFRQHVPLTTGEDTINFYPYGDSGLPISGEALLAIHAFPLGSLKVGGRFLVVHADQPDLAYRFAAEFLQRNRKLIDAARQAGEKKLPEPVHRAGTALIDTLLGIETKRIAAGKAGLPAPITAYHLSNSGQGVGLDIYHLPVETIDFIEAAVGSKYVDQWRRLCARGWQLVAGKKGRGAQSLEASAEPRFNVLYEDLLRLPEDAARFIRRYFLRVPERTRIPGDPRATYSLRSEYELVSWALTELFLRKVVTMDQDRIDQIRSLGDALADYVKNENDRGFFRAFLMARRYDELRATLIKANLACLKRGRPPVIAFDPYVAVFEEGIDVPYSDWRLARDLTLIRVIEKLHELGWIQTHVEDLPEPEVTVDASQGMEARVEA